MGAACGSGSGTTPALPTISGFTPVSGPAGTSVTITGTRLGMAEVVTFDHAEAQFTVVSDTELRADVPADATTGLIGVQTPEGSARTGTSFTVPTAPPPGPEIAGFTPTSGPIGTRVTIVGAHLAGAIAVAFNGTAAAPGTATDMQIATTVPAGATTGRITVTTPAGTAISASDFTVVPAPAITRFTPTSGPPGWVVTIEGMRFTGANGLAFNGTPGLLNTLTDTQISTTVPAGATTGPITVTTPGGTATSTNTFTVTPPTAPVIASLAPTSGPVGTSVEIFGVRFTGATAVAFNGRRAALDRGEDTWIFATVPLGATTGPVTVTTPKGTAPSPSDFTVTPSPRPEVVGFSPPSGPVGTGVTIEGRGLIGATAVEFNGVAGGLGPVGDNRIFAIVPLGATTGRIRVTTPGGTAMSAAEFRVLIGP